MNQKDRKEIKRKLRREQIKFFIILNLIAFSIGFIGRFILTYPYEKPIATKCYYYNESIDIEDTKFNLVFNPKENNIMPKSENVTVKIIDSSTHFPHGSVIGFTYSSKSWEDVSILDNNTVELECPKRTTTPINEIMNYFKQVLVRDVE